MLNEKEEKNQGYEKTADEYINLIHLTMHFNEKRVSKLIYQTLQHCMTMLHIAMI